MATLQHDMMYEVLLCLPVKDLLRFRCVSKPLHSLIDSRDFNQRHLSHSLKTNNNVFCLFEHGRFPVVQSLNSPIQSRTLEPIRLRFPGLLETLGSCNGLVALLFYRHHIVLWNPFTNKVRKLDGPSCPVEYYPYSMIKYGYSYGFGYDPSTDDYKLFRRMGKERHVYSMRNNRWREINGSPIYLVSGVGILVGSALHWEVRSPDRKIVAFDLVNEEFHDVPLPECFNEEFLFNVGVLGGCLCIAAGFRGGHGGADVDVWVMKEYGVMESWIKLFSLTPDILDARPNSFVPLAISNYLMPLAISKSGNNVLIYTYYQLFWYDMVNKSCEFFSECPSAPEPWPWMVVESRISPE